jgi:hypothetical protein
MLAETRTPWLARHDADDVLYPHRLARTVECITRYPESGMVCSLADYYPRGCYGQFRSTQGNPDQFRDLVASGYLPICCHPTVTLNVERTLAVGGYRFDLLVEDIDLWWRMALKYEIRLIPEVTVGVRQNVESISSANLAKQALHTLYIQYLLISHLWSLEPLPYEQACQHLSRLIDPRKLKSKTHLRGFNIELGRGNRCKALWELGSAILTSPASFLRRLLDELLVHRNICLGERPALFAKNRSALWQSASGQHEGIGNHTTNSNDFPSRSRFAASVSNLPRSPQNSRGSELSPL